MLFAKLYERSTLVIIGLGHVIIIKLSLEFISNSIAAKMDNVTRYPLCLAEEWNQFDMTQNLEAKGISLNFIIQIRQILQWEIVID